MLFSGSENAKIYRKLFRYCGIKHNLIKTEIEIFFLTLHHDLYVFNIYDDWRKT